MANPEHVKVVKEGAEAIAEWRKQHPNEHLDLSGADLKDAILFKASLLNDDCRGVDLSGNTIIECYFRGTNLSGANLSNTFILLSNFIGVNLSDASINNARCALSILYKVNLDRANLNKAMCSLVSFADCNIYWTRGLETVVHDGPSTIGVDTLMSSFYAAGNRLTPELVTFFRGAGVPKELLNALPGIIADVKYCSCFISYGEPDRQFADKLCKDLKDKGVSCWFYHKDYTPGERTQREIKEARWKAEKTVVLCSAESLTQAGVLKEIEEQIDEDPDKMVPVSLDNLWKKDNFLVMRANRNLKPFLLDRNYADFSDAKLYDEALEKLLKGLERKQVKRKKQRKQS